MLTPGQSIAVVGLSAKPDRASFDVARVMQQAGFRIYGVNPQYAGQVILGERCVASLAELAELAKPIDIVNCFRRSDDMPEVATAAVEMRPLPKVLWMQLGVANGDARRIAEAGGLQVIENRCIKIAYLNQA